jgi:hypothetical protein
MFFMQHLLLLGCGDADQRSAIQRSAMPSTCFACNFALYWPLPSYKFEEGCAHF